MAACEAVVDRAMEYVSAVRMSNIEVRDVDDHRRAVLRDGPVERCVGDLDDR